MLVARSDICALVAPHTTNDVHEGGSMAQLRYSNDTTHQKPQVNSRAEQISRWVLA